MGEGGGKVVWHRVLGGGKWEEGSLGDGLDTIGDGTSLGNLAES